MDFQFNFNQITKIGQKTIIMKKSSNEFVHANAKPLKKK